MFDYESVASAYGFRELRLPAAIELGDPMEATAYAAATVHVKGRGSDSTTFTGAPIVYALSVPRAAHVDALDQVLFVGTDVPNVIRVATR